MGSWGLIACFAVGILLGATVFPKKWGKINTYVQTAGISLMLFSMGVSMAGDPQFLTSLYEVGVRAVVYALAGIAGSVLVVWLLSRLFLGRGEEKQ